MSITISTDVFCDICGNWIHGVISHKPEARQARQLAKEAGWYRGLLPFSSKMSDVCPSCVKCVKRYVNREHDDET